MNSQPNGRKRADRLLAEQLRVLLGDALSSLVITAAAMVLAIVILYRPLASTPMNIWVLAAVLVLILRSLFVIARSNPGYRARLSTREWATVYLFLIAGSGAMWGSLVLMWHPALVHSTQLQMFLFPVSMAAGAVSAFGAWSPAFLSFLLPCLIPVIGVLLFGPSADHAVTALPASAFLAGLLLLGSRYQARIVEIISLKFDNEKLVEDLSGQNELLRDAKEQAETANLVKSEFLARVSHELRTPMNGVLGMTQVLRSTPLSSRQSELSQNIQSSAESLLDLIDDVLDLSELGADKIELLESEFNTQRLFRELSTQFESEAELKGLEFNIALSSDAPGSLWGDYARLKQILRNLVSNAIKFTDEGYVRVGLQVLEQYGSRYRLAFSVTDSGIGIAAEQQHGIYESFSQADNTSTRQHQGAGLGLTVSHKIAELMSADLQVESEPGQGSVFTLTIWMDHGLSESGGQADAEAGAELQEQTERSVLGTKILLAEDSEINQAVAEALLENMGCQVTIASNGAEAVKLVQKSSFDLILMDCQMPIMDGYEATRTIRALDESSDIKIVALTANAMKGDREKCLEAGMDEYLSKPFKADDLKSIIGELIGYAEPAIKHSEKQRSKCTMTSEPAEKVLDNATLDNLRMLDKGKGLICRVIDAFNSSIPALMDDLQAGIDAQDKDQVRMPAHTMKSSAANLGALAFSKQCAVIETLAREGNLEPVADEFDVLKGLLEPVLVELEQERQAAEARKAA